MDNYIKEEMEDLREKLQTRLSKLLPCYIEELSHMLSYCYRDGVPSALKIADDLSLCLLDMYALDEDEEKFQDEFTRQEGIRIGEEMYENTQRD